MNWISPNTITGDAATGQQYFRRPMIIEDFWREVKKGNHILFVAPRRVGKTSIMKDLAETCSGEFICIYQNIEGVRSRNEFYKCLFELILQCLNRSIVSKAKHFIQKCIKKYNITEIATSGVKFETLNLDYETEVRRLIPELKEAELHTVIFLDEFAEMISKLSKQGKSEDAIDILHTLRAMRSDSNLKHFTIVFAGSISLEFVIKSIARPMLINDLHRIKALALSSVEATAFIQQLVNGATIQFSPDVLEYLKSTIDHLLPYYIQLMIEDINLIAREKNDVNVSKEMIDAAVIRVIGESKNLADWHERLKAYRSDMFPFMNEILKHVAHKEIITIQEIYDKASSDKFNRIDDYMDYIQQLEADGYLLNTGQKSYRFVTPFLQKFWLNKYPSYNG